MREATNPIAVVVVTHNSADDLGPCLESLLEDSPAEVVVSDNASTDASCEVALRHGARVIEGKENLGYGAAANRGVAETSSPFVLVLNPDTIMRKGTLRAIVERFESDTSVSVVGPKILDPDGSIQQSARRFPSMLLAAAHGFLGLFWKSNPASVRYTMSDWDHDSAREVDWVSGAALAIRRDVWDDLGGFDPGYWMYVEDVDLCWRTHGAGGRVWFEPEGVVTHTIGTSSQGIPYRLLLAHHRSMLRFEHVRRGGRRGLTWPLVVAGVALRLAFVAAKRWVADYSARRARRPSTDGTGGRDRVRHR